MNVLIAFYSLTGANKRLAQEIAEALKKHSFAFEEIKPVKEYSKLSAYSLGCLQAMRKTTVEIKSLKNDVKKFDALIVLTPTWAWNMAPPVRTFLKQLSEGRGKTAVACASCGSSAGKAASEAARLLEDKGYDVKKVAVISRASNEGEVRKEISGAFERR
jgi:flavodoxin